MTLWKSTVNFQGTNFCSQPEQQVICIGASSFVTVSYKFQLSTVEINYVPLGRL